MNTLKLLASSLLLITLFAACAKQGQSQQGDTTQAAATAVKSGIGNGIVRAIDSSAKTITLDHGNVGTIMDAMTMEYPVSSASMLNGIAVGDSVRFTLEDRGEGNYMVTNITPIKKG